MAGPQVDRVLTRLKKNTDSLDQNVVYQIRTSAAAPSTLTRRELIDV